MELQLAASIAGGIVGILLAIIIITIKDKFL